MRFWLEPADEENDQVLLKERSGRRTDHGADL